MSDLDGSPWLIIYIGDGGYNGILSLNGENYGNLQDVDETDR